MAAPDDPAKPGPQTGMDKRDMKKLLVRARKGPVNVALLQGDSESGGGSLILMHKLRPSKGLLKDLKKQFPTGTNPCFGTAAVDQDADPQCVAFTMNKTYSGTERKLVKLLRGTGFKRVTLATGSTGDEDE